MMKSIRQEGNQILRESNIYIKNTSFTRDLYSGTNSLRKQLQTISTTVNMFQDYMSNFTAEDGDQFNFLGTVNTQD